MKLIYCSKCRDICRLDYEERSCLCNATAGFYKKDGRTAVIKGGDAVPLGINNNNFFPAIQAGKGNFEAWVIPVDSPWLEWMEC